MVQRIQELISHTITAHDALLIQTVDVNLFTVEVRRNTLIEACHLGVTSTHTSINKMGLHHPNFFHPLFDIFKVVIFSRKVSEPRINQVEHKSSALD